MKTVRSGLALENYRRRARWDALTPPEKEALASIADELATADEEEGEDTIELVDVIDPVTKATVYLFALWPFGSGVLVDLERNSVVADVAQHHFDARGDRALRANLGAAWERQHAALGVRETVTFARGDDPDAEEPTAKPGAILPRIEAMRAAIQRGSPADPKALWALVGEAIDLRVRRPLPVRRLFELDETTRAALELVHEGNGASATNLGNVGLPASPDDLARFLGHAPRGALDVPVRFGGEAHPAWCLVSDAVHDLRPHESILAALATLSSEQATALFRALMVPASNAHLAGTYAPPPKGSQPGSPAARGAHAERYIRFVVAFAQQLGDDGVRVAKETLATRADWVDRWLPQLTTSPQRAVPHWFELCIATGVLARAAKVAGSALDPSLDALLGALARYKDATYPLAVVLADLPPERAANVARLDLELIARFPSPESAPAAIERLEASGGGPYMEALFKRVVGAIGPPAAPALEAAIARGSLQKKVLAQCLSLVGKGAAKRKKKGGA